MGFPNSNPKSNPLYPQQKGGLSGTSVSTALRPGWALANPRLSKSRGSSPPQIPTPGASWTGVVFYTTAVTGPGVLSGCQVIRLSAVQCPLLPTAAPALPIHSIHPHVLPPVPSHHTPHQINESTRRACACCTVLAFTPHHVSSCPVLALTRTRPRHRPVLQPRASRAKSQTDKSAQTEDYSQSQSGPGHTDICLCPFNVLTPRSASTLPPPATRA